MRYNEWRLSRTLGNHIIVFLSCISNSYTLPNNGHFKTLLHSPIFCFSRALDDIKESIKELQYYRACIFKAPSEEKKHKIIGNSGNKRS